MQQDLMQTEESISPMNQWIREWCIQQRYDTYTKQFIVSRGSLTFSGFTMEEALSNLAYHLNIKMWDE